LVGGYYWILQEVIALEGFNLGFGGLSIIGHGRGWSLCSVSHVYNTTVGTVFVPLALVRWNAAWSQPSNGRRSLSVDADGSRRPDGTGGSVLPQRYRARLEAYQAVCALTGRAGVVRGPNSIGMYHMSIRSGRS
jgi:hypothetical protein